MPEVTTSGAAKGLQPVAHREYVQKGSTHQLHEQLVDGAASTFDKYQVSVTCSAIDEHGNPTGEKLTPASPTTSGDKKSQQSQVVVSKVSRATTTCVFRNDPTPPEPPVPSNHGFRAQLVGSLGRSWCDRCTWNTSHREELTFPSE